MPFVVASKLCSGLVPPVLHLFYSPAMPRATFIPFYALRLRHLTAPKAALLASCGAFAAGRRPCRSWTSRMPTGRILGCGNWNVACAASTAADGGGRRYGSNGWSDAGGHSNSAGHRSASHRSLPLCAPRSAGAPIRPGWPTCASSVRQSWSVGHRRSRSMSAIMASSVTPSLSMTSRINGSRSMLSNPPSSSDSERTMASLKVW